MPRTKLTSPPRYAPLRMLLRGYAHEEGRSSEELGHIMNASRQTVHRRMAEPGSMTLDELLALGRGLHIPIEDLRAVIRY